MDYACGGILSAALIGYGEVAGAEGDVKTAFYDTCSPVLL